MRVLQEVESMSLDDDATDAEELDRAVCLANARRGADAPILEATGQCLYCAAPVGDGERFCEGIDCRDDYVAQRNAEARRSGSR